MKRTFFFCIVLMVMAMQVRAQGVGINVDGSNPDNSAMLDIKSASNGSGLLIPQLQLGNVGITFNGGPAQHLFVTNLNASFNNGSRFNSGIGFYRNAGSKGAPEWRRFLESSDSTLFWGTRGNANTNPSTDFIGTTDNQQILIKANNQEKMNIPALSTEDLIISNVFALRVPLGASSFPSLKFTSGNNGMFGLGSPNSGVGFRLAATQYAFFSQSGLRIATSATNITPESSMLDVEGNIFIRKGKLIYTEFGSVPTFLNPEKTLKNEIHWDGTISASNDSPTFWDENGDFRLQVRRNASGQYFLQIATTTVKNFTCVNNLGHVTIVTTTADITTFHPVNFTTQITGPNGAQTITMREQANPAATYQIIVIVADGNVGVSLQRWQN